MTTVKEYEDSYASKDDIAFLSALISDAAYEELIKNSEIIIRASMALASLSGSAMVEFKEEKQGLSINFGSQMEPEEFSNVMRALRKEHEAIDRGH